VNPAAAPVDVGTTATAPAEKKKVVQPKTNPPPVKKNSVLDSEEFKGLHKFADDDLKGIHSLGRFKQTDEGILRVI